MQLVINMYNLMGGKNAALQYVIWLLHYKQSRAGQSIRKKKKKKKKKDSDNFGVKHEMVS
jgi:hypothetical protein